MNEQKNAFLNEMSRLDKNVKEAAKQRNQTNEEIIKATDIIKEDTYRIINVIDRAPAIIHDINTQFEMATKLKGKDIAFLFGAAAVQTIRWMLLPEIDWDFTRLSKEERLNSNKGGKIEKDGIKDYLKDKGYSNQQIKDMLESPIKNYTWENLLIAPVPYDAMHGSKRINIAGFKEAGKELNGINHHVATWGHDPVFGWVVGPMNITSRMITFRDFQTYHVKQIGETQNQIITYQTTVGQMVEKSINNWAEDSRKLFASVAKQGLHLQSDKYTKLGLPIPFLRSQKAQELLRRGWNSAEIDRMFTKAIKNLGVIGAQFGLALIIDNLVSALHLLCYDEAVDGPIGTYGVKTHKIVCYSNMLAEAANVVYVLATKQIGKLDIGGYINLARNLIGNEKFKTEVKAKFLEQELAKQLYGEEYYFTGGLNHDS